ncbi:polymeric immunoglobulin receptor-like [Neoarius graeffei]|uniref:polymeric immunoglobulin receptor-like n=1 Tax=Neoarius graeffei TaxID=443677 RepID=UPI00298C3508|nr:polymeric immunoglobulin receptor-like [Neoarius graeffei]
MALITAAHGREGSIHRQCPLTHFRMTLLLFLTVLLPQLSGVLCTVTTVGDQTLLQGQSITVPCLYNPEYIPNVKYWCKGSVHTFCTSLARTDESESAPFSNARITITDEPVQNVFMVTMRELKEEDSGWYWCGVEIGGIWNKDSYASLQISVKQGMSVVKDEVQAEEGGSVTVQCVYSEKHRENEKRWCRSGNLHSCKVTNNGTFSSKSLLISDNRKDTVTVTMRQLKMQDAGWYLCRAGEHQASVHVLVTPGSTTTALGVITQQHPFEVKTEDSSNSIIWPSLMVCGLLVCLLTATGLQFWRRQNLNPDLSVMESRVSAEEGGSVTVQCLYSTAYQKKQTQWCRFKDRSCYEVGMTPTSQNSAVQIRDDGKRSFSVQMSGLKKSDTGWYWCRAGDLQVPVHISVCGDDPDSTDSKECKYFRKPVMFCIAHR